MKQSTQPWTRNTDGLRSSAQRKAAATEQRAEAAIALLIKEQRPINFKTVAQTAGISTAWLYEHDAIKQQIMHLRMQQVPKPQVKIPKSEQASNASQATMISALKIQVEEQAILGHWPLMPSCLSSMYIPVLPARGECKNTYPPDDQVSFIISNPCNVRHAVSNEKKPIPGFVNRLMNR